MSLQVENVGFDYDGRPLLQDVDFQVAPGEQLFLVGPSGSGKSTILRLIAGLETARTGRICWQEQVWSGAVPPHQRHVGMLFQEPALFPHLNVRDNVGFGLPYSAAPKPEWPTIIAEELARVGLADRAKDRVDELSGGQRARVALARSLACKPRVMLLDEPFAALDKPLRDRLGPEVRDVLKASGIAAIWVTHDEDEAAALGDRTLRLVEGRLEAGASNQV